MEPVLPHHGDRLRQQPAASRHGLREDLRRRHRALQAAVRVRHALPDGERRALAERVQEGDRKRASIRWPTATGWSRSSGGPGSGSTSRSTTSSARPQPRHTAGVTDLVQRIYDAGDIYEGVYEGWYCVSCEEFKQEKDLVDGNCPLHPTLKPRVDSREELLLPAVEVSAAAARSLRRASRVPPAGDPPQRDPAPDRRRARGHLGQPRRAVVGHSAAVRSVERRLRLVRRADQLRVGGRPRRRRRSCSSAGGRRTCTSSARTSRGSTR